MEALAQILGTEGFQAKSIRCHLDVVKRLVQFWTIGLMFRFATEIPELTFCFPKFTSSFSEIEPELFRN